MVGLTKNKKAFKSNPIGDVERGGRGVGVGYSDSFTTNTLRDRGSTAVPGTGELEEDDANDLKERNKNKAPQPPLQPSQPVDSLSHIKSRVWIFASIIVLVGACVCATFVAVGVESAQSHHDSTFTRQASELVSLIRSSWSDFEVMGLVTNDKCREGVDQKTTYLERGICSRQGFADLYESLVESTSIDVQAMCWVVNVTDAERSVMEEEAYAYYGEHYPDIEYRGFVGLQPDAEASKGVSLQPRDKQPFYYVIHLCAPIAGYNLAALDFDARTSPVRYKAIEIAMNTRMPSLTGPLILLRDTQEKDGFSVILIHPGVTIESQENVKPQGASFVVVRMRALLTRAVRGLAGNAAVYVFDTTNSSEALFLGAINTKVDEAQGPLSIAFLENATIDAVRNLPSKTFEDTISIANRQWSVVVVDTDDNLDLVFVILGGVIIFFACFFLAAWYLTSARREARLNEMKIASEAEKSALIVENAEKAAVAERELNGFLAHEVRNPLAAAISACSFVSASIHETPPLVTKESQESVREDVSVIHSSLQYINDLLRNMLDIHRVSSHQMKVELSPTDLRKDVLDPVATLLYRRGDEFKVLLECDAAIVVMTDRIRLKQIVLNLANNARKFVTKGFIRLRGEVVNDKVRVYVEDTGPGIPLEKRGKLFDKYQESLDLLNQGTGIGLSLCKDLSLLMNGDVWLDESYDSGVHGFPGARFVIDLNVAPLELSSSNLDQYAGSPNGQASERRSPGKRKGKTLPEKLSILFVDDDMILRKLFGRSVKRICPDWDIDEACNGETALRMAETKTYDIIFLDHYMASYEKQLLGTETARALRAHGVESIICGLSANDVEESFLNAGANSFLFKPFPCEAEQLEQELIRIYYGSALCSVKEDPEEATFEI